MRQRLTMSWESVGGVTRSRERDSESECNCGFEEIARITSRIRAAERKTSDIVEIVLLYEWRMGIKKESSNGGAWSSKRLKMSSQLVF